MLTPIQTLLAVLGALGTFTTAIVAWRRAGPDRTRAWVGTAADLVAVSDGLRKSMEARVESLEAEVAAMRAHQRDRDAEMAGIRSRNRALEDRVAVLERTLRTHDIPVPPDPT